MSQSDWTKSAGNSPHYHKTQDCKSRVRAVLLDSQMVLFPAWAPLTKKFCRLSSHVSPWISNFQVLDKSSLLEGLDVFLSPRCVSVSRILPGLLCVTGKVIEPVRGDRVLWNLHTKPMEPHHREFFPGS